MLIPLIHCHFLDAGCQIIDGIRDPLRNIVVLFTRILPIRCSIIVMVTPVVPLTPDIMILIVTVHSGIIRTSGRASI